MHVCGLIHINSHNRQRYWWTWGCKALWYHSVYSYVLAQHTDLKLNTNSVSVWPYLCRAMQNARETSEWRKQRLWSCSLSGCYVNLLSCALYRPTKSHALGVILTHSKVISRILVSRASKSHALMKYSLKVGVAARTAHAQFIKVHCPWLSLAYL